jgi:hypothetical protein
MTCPVYAEPGALAKGGGTMKDLGGGEGQAIGCASDSMTRRLQRLKHQALQDRYWSRQAISRLA